mmetsp:Transcript_10071/g.17554  ORF Transcript_10071/g.17554 Transcript_10071/m.17554 type:complete len:321 (-) Transcript_10071:329-1291(-)
MHIRMDWSSQLDGLQQRVLGNFGGPFYCSFNAAPELNISSGDSPRPQQDVPEPLLRPSHSDCDVASTSTSAAVCVFCSDGLSSGWEGRFGLPEFERIRTRHGIPPSSSYEALFASIRRAILDATITLSIAAPASSPPTDKSLGGSSDAATTLPAASLDVRCGVSGPFDLTLSLPLTAVPPDRLRQLIARLLADTFASKPRQERTAAPPPPLPKHHLNSESLSAEVSRLRDELDAARLRIRSLEEQLALVRAASHGANGSRSVGSSLDMHNSNAAHVTAQGSSLSNAPAKRPALSLLHPNHRRRRARGAQLDDEEPEPPST